MDNPVFLYMQGILACNMILLAVSICYASHRSNVDLLWKVSGMSSFIFSFGILINLMKHWNDMYILHVLAYVLYAASILFFFDGLRRSFGLNTYLFVLACVLVCGTLYLAYARGIFFQAFLTILYISFLSLTRAIYMKTKDSYDDAFHGFFVVVISGIIGLPLIYGCGLLFNIDVTAFLMFILSLVFFILSFMVLDYVGRKVLDQNLIKNHGKLSLIVNGASVAVGTIMLILLFLLVNIEHAEIEKISDTLSINGNFIASEFNNFNRYSSRVVQSLVSLFQIREYFSDPSIDNTLAAYNVIDMFNAGFGTSIIYVTDSNGTTLLSTNRYSDKSFEGHNYAFRPYIQDALEGRSSVYLARGITSGERGLYFSSPVRLGNKIVGVGVAKNSVDNYVPMFRFFKNVYLVSPDGLIFISSDNDDLYKFISDVDTAKASDKNIVMQFGKVKKDSVGFYSDGSGWHNADGSRIVAMEFGLDIPGWKIFMFDDTSSIDALIVKYIYVFLSIIFFLFMLFIFFLHYYLDNVIIRVSEANYSSLFENSNDLIITTKPNGEIVYMNPVAKKILGISRPDGRSIQRFIIRSNRAKFRKIVVDAINGNDPGVFRIKCRPKKGKEVLLEGTVHCMNDDDSPGFVTLILQDISSKIAEEKKEAKRRKELEQLNRFAINREIKMIELKKKLEECSG